MLVKFKLHSRKKIKQQRFKNSVFRLKIINSLGADRTENKEEP